MIITYHNIGKHTWFNTVAFDAFQSQISYLKRHYKIVDIDHYVDQILKTGKNLRNEVVLTFDDGYSSFQNLILPFLEAENIPAALFICNEFIGKSNGWDLPQYQIPILNEQQLKHLSTNSLITIGAHSLSHRSLTTLSDVELKEELLKSKQGLEQLIQRPVKYLAYPYGQYFLNVDKRVFRTAKDAGYEAAMTSNFDNSNTVKDLFCLNRIDITGIDREALFQSKLKKYNYYSLKQKIKNVYSFLKQSVING